MGFWKIHVERVRGWEGLLKVEVTALGLASRDPRVTPAARVLLFVVLAYAVSPIDLIPDFIPVLGYLDDLVLVPLGLAMAIRLIPEKVLAECRAHASAASRHPADAGRRQASRVSLLVGAMMVVFCWCAVAGVLMFCFGCP